MEKKTKLITIDYDEYIQLIAFKNNSQIEIFMKLKDELYKFLSFFDSYRDYNKSEIKHMIDHITNAIDNKIMEIEKEPTN